MSICEEYGVFNKSSEFSDLILYQNNNYNIAPDRRLIAAVI